MREELFREIEDGRKSVAYANYLDTRDHVLRLLDAAEAVGDRPSDYWKEELAGFDYMFDASPLIINKIREHCYHITGLRSYDYRGHHGHLARPFDEKLSLLQQADTEGLLVPENPALGGFGHRVQGKLVNIDTLKFYESLIAMNKGGALEPFKNCGKERRIVVEIGAGWGGFAYQFKTLFPNTTYVVVDLPQTMLFSATYLRSIWPDAKVMFYGSTNKDALASQSRSCDFLFVPHYAFAQVPLPQLDLAINMVSFQEMTSEQVAGYVTRCAELGCRMIYSHNRDRSAHNQQLTAVGKILKQAYRLNEIKILDVPYTALSLPRPPTINWSTARRPREFFGEVAKAFIQKQKAGGGKKKYSHLDYRHLIGLRAA